MSAAYIVAAVRTAAGRKAGRLADWHPADLAGKVLDALVERTHADRALIDDVIMGCVSQVGQQAGNVARNAILASKLPESVPGTSVDRQCGSSQQALHFAAQAVMSGAMDVVIAAGVESMSRVPMGLSSQLPAKNGFGTPKSPKMEERYPDIQFSQFMGAEMMAKKFDLSKDALDEYAFHSHQRAIAATKSGTFEAEASLHPPADHHALRVKDSQKLRPIRSRRVPRALSPACDRSTSSVFHLCCWRRRRTAARRTRRFQGSGRLRRRASIIW
jgi:acetyl-CoA C-acetyltransferase